MDLIPYESQENELSNSRSYFFVGYLEVGENVAWTFFAKVHTSKIGHFSKKYQSLHYFLTNLRIFPQFNVSLRYYSICEHAVVRKSEMNKHKPAYYDTKPSKNAKK